jgi:hypothetical protein
MMILPPPTDGIFFSWTTDQTEKPGCISDSDSDSDSDSEDAVGTDQFWNREDLFDDLSHEVIEVVQHKKDVEHCTERRKKIGNRLKDVGRGMSKYELFFLFLSKRR